MEAPGDMPGFPDALRRIRFCGIVAAVFNRLAFFVIGHGG